MKPKIGTTVELNGRKFLVQKQKKGEEPCRGCAGHNVNNLDLCFDLPTCTGKSLFKRDGVIYVEQVSI